ncbi:dienelactone hydrolase family protein [Roseiflexus sp.]|uniref:dienelactone hydrolase family protein n=1 Tax=Roseiflexus sp. TaxID=2562120 RepID=UPI00398A75BC
MALGVLIGMTILAIPPAFAQSAPSGVAEEDFTVTLGDGWVSRAKLTYPARQAGPFPTVLLIANPDVTMDFLVPPIINDPIYKDLAEYLSARGIAVVRYNPRYVTGPGEYADQDKVFAQTPPDMLADAERVLTSIRANPRVDGQRVFVFGWSFSSLAATALAVKVPEIAGLILVGPISTTDRQVFIEDYTEVVLPYLLTFAPDGRITAEAITRAQAGDGGLLAIILTGFAFTDPKVTDRIAVNPFFDKNGDGVLDLNAEILPNLGAWVDTDPVVAIVRMLPNVYDQAASLRQSVLILQGENDGSSRVRNIRGLNNAFANHPDYTLRVYAGLGHSLSPARGVSYDNFTFYSEQPKADMAAWVLARAARIPSALPRTGGSEQPATLALLALFSVLASGIGWWLRRAAVR